ncbi:MAG: site-specific tyrosine recombinase XerD [Planctomycetota bacterium]|nr:site-specific tyrosine recombinase XerD [Planctomycetaceae bacterium]MDQ3330953.1 site-specific tyrosine recombinase XerD [Planctomycetota bacterium]
MPPRFTPPAGSRFSAVTAKPARLDVHVEPFLHYLDAECGMAANTLAAYRTDMQQFAAWFADHGPASLKQVDLQTLSRYLDHLHARNLKATSIARHLVTIKTFFRYLVLEAVVTESAAELLNSPKLWQKLPAVLSPEAVDRLLAAPTRQDRYPLRDRAILAVMYATGCRTSEVIGLTLDAVHLTERFCRALGKGNKERLVSLNPVAIAALEAYLAHERPLLAREDSRHLFVSRSGKPLTRVMMWMLVKRYAGRIGASRQVSPHTLRHSFATHMLAGGAEIRALQELLGHASIRTTQIYTHVEHSRLKSVHAKHHPRG